MKLELHKSQEFPDSLFVVTKHVTMRHSVPVLLFLDAIKRFSCDMPSCCPSLSPIYIMQSDQSTVRSTFNSESIDESVTNCHMFGYDKQRIGKFLRRATPVSYATHCKVILGDGIFDDRVQIGSGCTRCGWEEKYDEYSDHDTS
jgi:hypothetical protein